MLALRILAAKLCSGNAQTGWKKRRRNELHRHASACASTASIGAARLARPRTRGTSSGADLGSATVGA